MRRLLATVLVAAGLAACGPVSATGCDDDGVSKVAEPTNPLMSPALMQERPEPRRDRLAAAMSGWPDPFGEVLAGVDYNYDQWLRLYGVSGGVLAFTKRNAPVTKLSAETLEPVWALRPSTKRIAWDASADQFLLLSLPEDEPIAVRSFSLDEAEERWCTPLLSIFEEGDPLATTVLADDSVVVAAKSGTSAEVVRLDAENGEVAWRENLPAVDRVDYVGALGGQIVVGGREDHHLASGEHPAPTDAALTGVSAETGEFIWRYGPADGGLVHVLGTSDARLVLLERGEHVRLVGLKANGRRAWARRVPPTALQSALRGDVVLLKSRTHYLGYDATNGKPLWKWPIPTDRTFAPYGFTLGQMPAVDARHVLMPTTSELLVLDVQSGKPAQRLPMPTDGVSTTHWPYQLVATDRLFGVVTNTGAIVVRRTG